MATTSQISVARPDASVFRIHGGWRAPGIVIAVALLALGLYPGPILLLRDPTWQANAVVGRLPAERAYWASGLLLMVGPAIVVANMLPRAFDRFSGAILTKCARTRASWFVAFAVLFATAAAAAAAVYVFSRMPTTSDEIAQLWHARILLTGRLWLPPDPNPEFFSVDNIVDQGRWYSQFPIGGPATLVVPMLLHATWLLNPVLAGLTVANVYRFAVRAYGVAEARVAAALCAASPFILVMSGSFMNHTPIAFLATLALAELPSRVSSEAPRGYRASITIGAALGLAIAIRPLDGAIATLILGTFVVYDAVRSRHILELVVTIAAGAVPIAWLLVSNWLTTGRPLLFGYEVLWGANHSLGFHADPTGHPHTPGRGLLLAVLYTMQLNWSLFEWPVAGLVVVGGALAAIRKLARWDGLLLGWVGVQLVAYAAYWHAGTFFGPRYLFTVVPALLLIVARGIVSAVRESRPVGRRSILAALGACVVSSWLLPTNPVGAIGLAESARPIRAAFKIDLDPVVNSLPGTRALVFVSETASERLIRRLWGLGISRPDAARLVEAKDNCALLQAVIDEELRTDSPSGRLSRLEHAVNYSPSSGSRLIAPDPTFRASDRQSYTPLCEADLRLDTAADPVSYGAALLINQIDATGRISGPLIFVADLGQHNEVLRHRFGDRRWYRLALPKGDRDRVPRLVPYE